MDLYTEAAAVLKKFENKQGSVKGLVFATNYKNIRQLYALVCESLKYQHVLLAIFKACSLLQKEEMLDGQTHLATVLLYEHLVGKGLGRAGRIRSCILKHKHEIRAACRRLLEEKGVSSLADLLSAQCQTLNNLPIPRYARVNLLKMTVEDVVAAFTAEGWIWSGTLSLVSFQSSVEALGVEGFARDPLLPDLLIFPPATDLHDHPLTSAGKIVLQDRASCFPAHVLNPPLGATVLDCCAAPGNKTSHLASLLANSGKILAFDHNDKRISLLRHHLQNTGVTNAKTFHQDFLSINPQDDQFAGVEYILVDPSCSGSGIINRMDHIDTDSSTATSRLRSLQRFQISILKQALHFPAVHRVVYSTCSVHQEENEAVILEVADQFQAKFQVKKIFPELSQRGSGSDEICKCCLRMCPKEDLTNGFFIACFERAHVKGKKTDENNEKNELVLAALTQKAKKKRKHCSEENVDTHEDYKLTTFTPNVSLCQTLFNESTPNISTKKSKKKKRKKCFEEDSQGQQHLEQKNGVDESLINSLEETVPKHTNKMKNPKCKKVRGQISTSVPYEIQESDLHSACEGKVQGPISTSVPYEIQESDLHSACEGKVQGPISTSVPYEIQESDLHSACEGKVQGPISTSVPYEIQESDLHSACEGKVQGPISTSVPYEIQESDLHSACEGKVQGPISTSVPYEIQESDLHSACEGTVSRKKRKKETLSVTENNSLFPSNSPQKKETLSVTENNSLFPSNSPQKKREKRIKDAEMKEPKRKKKCKYECSEQDPADTAVTMEMSAVKSKKKHKHKSSL